MGACVHKGTTKKGEKTPATSPVDLTVTANRSTLRFATLISNLRVTGSDNQITILSCRNIASALRHVIVEGAGNKVRIERDAQLVEVLGLNNAVTVGGKAEVGRIIILGREYGNVSRRRNNRKQDYQKLQSSPRVDIDTDTTDNQSEDARDLSPGLKIN